MLSNYWLALSMDFFCRSSCTEKNALEKTAEKEENTKFMQFESNRVSSGVWCRSTKTRFLADYKTSSMKIKDYSCSCKTVSICLICYQHQ